MPFPTLLRNGVGTGGVEMWAGFLRVKCVGAIRPIEQGLGGEKGRVEWRGAGGRGGGVRGVWVSKKTGAQKKKYTPRPVGWVCEVMPVKGKSAE